MSKNYDFHQGEVLLIDKPLHWTSFDAVNKIRKTILKINPKKIKVGHAGTLDPLATGLLIICTGKKTKEIEQLQGLNKAYTAEFYLGKTTPSYDGETEADQEFDISHIDRELIDRTRTQFLGAISQLPPIYSAIKIKGRKSYDLARKGKEVKLEPREVFIEKFDIISYEKPSLLVHIQCSKGTYIRSIAHDFGKALGAGAYLTGLRRTKIGEYSVNQAFELSQFIESLASQI